MGHAYTRSQHPLVFVFTHWTNLLAMLCLTISGFYIHFPYLPGLMGLARGTHFFWMFVLLINMVFRIVLAFMVRDSVLPDGTGKELDIKNFVPQKENRHQLWPTLKYYLFLKKEHPIQGKYNPLQKMAYVLTIPLTLAAAYTGFCLWGPTYLWPAFAAGTEYVGGLENMRIIHYYCMWAILLFTAIHAYLANIYGLGADKIMFFWQETLPEKH
ncbi:MAG: cytochrome B [Actinobacteria bacterium]|nr:MAG: cytochrome B [Actinomycetota bacterium]